MRPGPWLAAVAAALLTPTCGLFQPAAPENLLVVAVDGLRLDALHPGLGAPSTPNAQELAASGVSFAWCYAHSAASLPANAALLSGRTPSGSHVRVDRQAVDPGVALLQEGLREAGWQTYGVFSSPELAPPAPGKGLDRGFQLCRTATGDALSAAEVNAQAIPMLERANPDAPWFAYVQYSDPTAPYAAHGTADRSAQVLLDGRALDRVGTSDPAPWRRTLRAARGPHRLEVRADEDVVVSHVTCTAGGEALELTVEAGATDRPGRTFAANFELAQESEVEVGALLHDVPDVTELRERYRLEVEAFDRALGELLACLQRNGQYERTTIVLVAPHGESLGEHGQFGHGPSLYDEVLRVPLVIRPAARQDVRPELLRRALEPVRVADLAPTLLEMLGERQLPRTEGASLLRDAERSLVAEVHPPQAASTLVAMRDERYKLVYTAAEDRFEMFAVKSDTLELENVFALQGHFRLQWQAQLRELAERAPQGADRRLGQLAPAGARARSRP